MVTMKTCRLVFFADYKIPERKTNVVHLSVVYEATVDPVIVYRNVTF